MTEPGPPRLARHLLSWLASEDDWLVGDLDEELATHQEPELGVSSARRWYWRQVLRSVPPLAARKAGRALETLRRRRGGDGRMSELAQDLRYTLRTLRKNAAFTGVILLTLALGIGANTVIYSVVDGLVLHPFPFPDGDRLVAVGTQYPKLGATMSATSSTSARPSMWTCATSRARSTVWSRGTWATGRSPSAR